MYDDQKKEIGQNRSSKVLSLGSSFQLCGFEIEISGKITGKQFKESETITEVSSTIQSSSVLSNHRLPARSFIQVSNSASIGKPTYNPLDKNAIILSHGCADIGTVDILVDPYLGQRLRHHQKEGVKFMFECVTGMRNNEFEGRGCVLADDMGLGKTLQAITLIWTLLKQTPRGNGWNNKPFVWKCVIVCPASLIGNWSREFHKFLGSTRLLPITVTETGAIAERNVQEFIATRNRRVLIISYETYRKFAGILNSCVGFDLLVCDEGHRLKSAQGNKTIDALLSCPTDKRIILTGTPLQNHLDEFYAVIAFVNPKALGCDFRHFKKHFQIPIEKGRDKEASAEEIEIANLRLEELSSLTRSFILRRKSDQINLKFLPPKMEISIFLRLTEEQVLKYEDFIGSNEVLEICQSDSNTSFGIETLRLVTKLKQLCTSPYLIKDDHDSLSVSPFNLLRTSSKFKFLEQLLIETSRVGDRIVLVSSFTSTLDLSEILLKANKLTYLRLDGRTKLKDRQTIVNSFNEHSSSTQYFAFLLSSKAGGCGLNLIGANRLVLLDLDWNPAIDAQSMARIWRDGQQKPTFIYRILCSGTIEEKIFQRQIMKAETCEGLIREEVHEDVESKIKNINQCTNENHASSFSKLELKDLFELKLDSDCNTYDLLQDSWPKYENPEESIIGDEVLKAAVTECGSPIVSWVHFHSADEESTPMIAKNASLDKEDENLVSKAEDKEAYVFPEVNGPSKQVSKEDGDDEEDLL